MLAIGLLQNTLLSAMTAYVLPSPLLLRMDKAFVKLLRYMMLCRQKGDSTGRRISMQAVYLFWKIPSVVVELRVRRIKQYQRWALSPSNHVVELAAMLGSTKHDDNHTKVRLGNDFRVTADSTPWAKQCLEDLAFLGK